MMGDRRVVYLLPLVLGKARAGLDSIHGCAGTSGSEARTLDNGPLGVKISCASRRERAESPGLVRNWPPRRDFT